EFRRVLFRSGAADRLRGTGLDAVAAAGLPRTPVGAQAGIEGDVAWLLELADEFAQALHRERLIEGIAAGRGIAVGQFDPLQQRLGAEVEDEVEALATQGVAAREVDRADFAADLDAGAMAAAAIEVHLQLGADRAFRAGTHAGVAAHAALEIDRIPL